MAEMSCPIHDGRQQVMVCMSCSFAFVCDECIEEQIHRGHELRTFGSASKRVLENLKLEIEITQKRCIELLSDSAHYRYIIDSEIKVSEKERREITRKRDEFKRYMDEVAEILLRNHEQEEAVVLNNVSTAHDQTQEGIRKANTFTEDVMQLEKCENAVEIITRGDV